jgi:hypothetical protein
MLHLNRSAVGYFAAGGATAGTGVETVQIDRKYIFDIFCGCTTL